MQVSISEGAKLAGKNRKSLYRDIQSGRLSSSKSADGQRQVDIAELTRVYGSLETHGDTDHATDGEP